MITLLIGGVRAGKSSRALAIAEARPDHRALLFVATAQAFDDEMRVRIDAHQRERSARWFTLESPIEVVNDLDAFLSTHDVGVVVIDCVTLWVSNVLLSLGEDADAESVMSDHTRSLIELLHRSSDSGTDVIIVTNEVGLGIVPPTPLGRRYRDALGRANQLLAGAADEATLLVAGLEVRLK